MRGESEVAKSKIAILKSYGSVTFSNDYAWVECIWGNDNFHRIGYGDTEREAANRVLNMVYHMMLTSVTGVESI